MTRGVELGGQGTAYGTGVAALLFTVAVLGMFALVTTLALAGSLFAGRWRQALLMLPVAALFDGLCTAFALDFFPRRGSLEGTMLEVRGARGTRRCDLATAEVIRVAAAMDVGGGIGRPLLRSSTLLARQERGSPAVRLLLRGPDSKPFPAEHLHLLAAAIGQRPEPLDQSITRAVQRLNELADAQEARQASLAAMGVKEDWPEGREPSPIVPDWSHRTGRPAPAQPTPPHQPGEPAQLAEPRPPEQD